MAMNGNDSVSDDDVNSASIYKYTYSISHTVTGEYIFAMDFASVRAASIAAS